MTPWAKAGQAQSAQAGQVLSDLSMQTTTNNSLKKEILNSMTLSLTSAGIKFYQLKAILE